MKKLIFATLALMLLPLGSVSAKPDWAFTQEKILTRLWLEKYPNESIVELWRTTPEEGYPWYNDLKTRILGRRYTFDVVAKKASGRCVYHLASLYCNGDSRTSCSNFLGHESEYSDCSPPYKQKKKKGLRGLFF